MQFQLKMGERDTNIGRIIIVVISLLFVLFEKSYGNVVNDCKFPAIFNFGDSNSDTGSHPVKFKKPHGMTWEREAGDGERGCDGRVIIDFFAEKLGLSYLRGFLGHPVEGADYRNGVNFAIWGSAIHHVVNDQQNGFIEFRNQTLELYASKGDQPNRPKPEDFSKALYTIDIGQNDVAYANAQQKPLDIVALWKLSGFIEELYRLDARRFWIHNTGPLGCLDRGDPKDEIGCSTKVNEAAQEYNKQLKDTVNKLREKYKDASFVYVDVYSAKYSLFKDAAKLGFKDPFGSVIGECEKDMKSEKCRPKEYIIWDGTHYTEAANKIVADRIMDGSLSDPPLPLTGACPSSDSPKTEL